MCHWKQIFTRTNFYTLLSEDRSHLKFHMSFFELLGNDASDLLDDAEHKKVDIAEDQFGNIVTRCVLITSNQCQY